LSPPEATGPLGRSRDELQVPTAREGGREADEPLYAQATQKIDQYEQVMASIHAIENRLWAHRAEGSAAERSEVEALTMMLKKGETELERIIAELTPLLESHTVSWFRDDSAGRPIIAAAELLRPWEVAGRRDKRAEAAVSRPLTQLMEYLGRQQKYHGAHLIPYRHGGPDKGNLVPLEDSVNTSYMAVTENQISTLMERPDVRLYLLAKVTYLDPPEELSESFELLRAINPNSRFKRKAEFSLMELLRVPDEIDYRVIDLGTGETMFHDNFFSGGQILDFLLSSRARLEQSDPDLARKVLDRQGRRAYIEQLKREMDKR
jgi:hypothetical protein